jgi:glycosyltransferase involved in cell wall biosynthesis
VRIAFITPEFVTDYCDGGGLGNYLNRMGTLLVERGHEVEIFLPSLLEPRVLMHHGIRVERVRVSPQGAAKRLLRRTLLRGRPLQWYRWRDQAKELAAAMERRHREASFSIIQSADYLAVGLAVQHRDGRVHLVRCSTAADLYNEIDGRKTVTDKCREELELASMRLADRVYAPSRFVVEHFRSRHNIDVELLRPPISMEVCPSMAIPCGLPERFMVHFGQLIERKGTLWLCEALRKAFVTDPSLRMIFVGNSYSKQVADALERLGSDRAKVLALHPLPKPELYALLQRAHAVVLPSLVDNLPNTVIESLMLGLPVIGTRGASISELVEQNKTGELVAPRDVDGLAAAISKLWRGNSPVRKGFKWENRAAAEMQPDEAVARFFKLASIE